MASKISPCLLACVAVLFLAQNNAAKSLVPICNYGCAEKDLETEDGYHASGSAISSQFLLPDGSVVTNSKETSISSDGIKQTFHQLKKEADRYVQTGQGGPVLHPHLPTFGNIPNLVPGPVAAGSYYTSSGSNSHDSYAQTTKDHDLEKKLIYSLSPSASSNSQYNQFQGQHNAVQQSSNSHPIVCDVCGVYHSGVSGGKSDTTASYNTIVGNVAPSVSSSSSYQKYESASQHKNATQQSSQPILFANSVKPNTFTTNIIDFNQNNNQNGQGSETQINYHESGSGQIKTSERVISQPTYSGGLLYPTKQLVVEVSKPGAGVVSSQNYQKQESSSSQVHQSGNHAAAGPVSAVPVSVYVKQQEADLAKLQREKQEQEFRSPVLLGGVPQNIPLESGHSSYYSSSSSSSSSSSKTVTSSDNGGSPVVIHQSTPQKYSSSSGYTSGSSYSSSAQNAPEVYYNGDRVQGVSSSIYDRVRADANAETLCTSYPCQPCVTCNYPIAGAPIKNSYGVATSYSSQSQTVNGKTTENREAAVAVNDNGKVDSYHVKT